MEWEDDYDDRYPFDDGYEEDYDEEQAHRPSRKTNLHRTHRDRNHREESGNQREGYGSRREGNRREGNRRDRAQRQDGYEDEFGDYNIIDEDTGYQEPTSLAAQSVATSSEVEEFSQEEEEEELFQLGDGLPALPPKMRSPLRQGEESIKAQEFEPEPTTEAFSMPPGSDLSAVGKIGVYQMAQHNSASSMNMIFWVYVLTLLVTYVLARR